VKNKTGSQIQPFPSLKPIHATYQNCNPSGDESNNRR